MLKLLEWDSAFFGTGIAQLNPDFIVSIDSKILNDSVKENNVQFLQTLIETSNSKQTIALENLGFHFVDLRITLEVDFWNVNNLQQLINVRPANIEDIDLINEISLELVKDSRYSGYFDALTISRFYKTWALKAIKSEFDNLCSVICDENLRVNGFITIRFQEKCSQIGLIAISKNCQNKAYGSKLLNHFVNESKNKGFQKGNVVTEGKNIHAINFYIKSGFKIKKIESWYYKTF